MHMMCFKIGIWDYSICLIKIMRSVGKYKSSDVKSSYNLVAEVSKIYVIATCHKSVISCEFGSIFKFSDEFLTPFPSKSNIRQSIIFFYNHLKIRFICLILCVQYFLPEYHEHHRSSWCL